MALMTKTLLQNVTQYGTQTMFVVDSVGHRKTSEHRSKRVKSARLLRAAAFGDTFWFSSLPKL